jgi:hypothetical protein
MEKTKHIFADDVIEARRHRLLALFVRMGGTEIDAIRRISALSGLSGSFVMKYKRQEIINPTIRSLEKLDRAMLRLEEQYPEEQQSA